MTQFELAADYVPMGDQPQSFPTPPLIKRLRVCPNSLPK